jgi:hypothetical protein
MHTSSTASHGVHTSVAFILQDKSAYFPGEQHFSAARLCGSIMLRLLSAVSPSSGTSRQMQIDFV